MTDEQYTKARDEAAEEQANGASSAINYMTKYENYIEGFSRGADWGREYALKEIEELKRDRDQLREAFNIAMEPINEIADHGSFRGWSDDGTGFDENLRRRLADVRQRAREALAKSKAGGV